MLNNTLRTICQVFPANNEQGRVPPGSGQLTTTTCVSRHGMQAAADVDDQCNTLLAWSYCSVVLVALAFLERQALLQMSWVTKHRS